MSDMHAGPVNLEWVGLESKFYDFTWILSYIKALQDNPCLIDPLCCMVIGIIHKLLNDVDV